MGILLGVIVLFAILSAFVAIVQAASISRMATAGGTTWRGWLFGWWRFESVANRAGLAGEQAAAIYKRAVIACLAFVILGLLLSGWAVNERRAETTANLGNRPITDWQGFPAAHYADNSALRYEALLPGAALLES